MTVDRANAGWVNLIGALVLGAGGSAALGEAAEPGIFVVSPVAETEPVPSGDDAADDPAIWVDLKDGSRSVILGTDKKSGLGVYDLTGKVVQFIPCGPINNVDLRQGVRIGERTLDLVAGTRRTDGAIVIFEVDSETRALRQLGEFDSGMGVDAYGVCMSWEKDAGRCTVIANDKRGVVRQWEIRRADSSGVEAVQVREFHVGGQTEGMVADEATGRLYIGEENAGIWSYALNPAAGTERVLFDAVRPAGDHLEQDVEGLAIARGADGRALLVTSSQGNSTFVVYDLADGTHAFTFTVGASGGVDAVTETDGLDVCTAALGPEFPTGIVVVQDDENDGLHQNFKIVSWQSIVMGAPGAR